MRLVKKCLFALVAKSKREQALTNQPDSSRTILCHKTDTRHVNLVKRCTKSMRRSRIQLMFTVIKMYSPDSSSAYESTFKEVQWLNHSTDIIHMI